MDKKRRIRKAKALAALVCGVLGALGMMGVDAAQAESNGTANLNWTPVGAWQFRQARTAQPPESGWTPATVPGDVHLDLLANKRIEDPFYRDNEAKLQWIEKVGWEYRLNFEPPASMLARQNIDLVFEGLDGSCEVWLNGQRILNADNAFRIWRVGVKKQLRAGTNNLWVLFHPPLVAAARVAAADPWSAKTHVEAKTYIRKPAYEFGWDWGPRFVTSGLWRPVRLEGWDKMRIADFTVRQRDMNAAVARVNAQVEVEAVASGPAKVVVQYNDGEKTATVETQSYLHAGRNTIDTPITIRDPKLWFPAGYGDQALYSFSAQVSNGNGNGAIERRELKTGLRSVELRREQDKWGRSFELVVNGVPIFAKGADVIPFDSFPSRVTAKRQRAILESARDANMNMIRVWGGGYYESDEFYQICDELGLMVWQDFMFGNDWQPGTVAFKQSIEAEAEDQLRRLRNHPSIVLWCGNNETELAFNWGERWALPADVRLKMWQDYLSEFSGILPNAVMRLSPETPYWPSSPSANFESVSDSYQSGDAHDWSVWHGHASFSDYEKRRWRFVTEFGFQSFPEQRTVESFTAPEDRASITTPVMLAHQKNKQGNAIIKAYMSGVYPPTKDFASFLYVSQVLQAEGIKVGAEHFRRMRPVTMGSLYWQLNDCWPVASWSSIDSLGRWKALQYYARRFYAPVLVSPRLEDGAVKIYAVNDKTKPVDATLRVRLMDFDGRTLLDESSEVQLPALSSGLYLTWPLKKLSAAGAADTSRIFVSAQLSAGGAEFSRNLIYLAPLKEVRLKPAPLKVEASGAAGNYKIRVSSAVLARSVYLSFGDLDVNLSENYFDILPWETMEVRATGAFTLDALRSHLKAISLVDAFAEPPSRATLGAAK